MDYSDLNTAVIELHNAARSVERDLGQGKLSEDIRDCADRLHALIKENYTIKETSN